jgi:hypothetical protein
MEVYFQQWKWTEFWIKLCAFAPNTPSLLTRLLLAGVGMSSTPCQLEGVVLVSDINRYCTYLLPEIELSLLEITPNIIT